MRRSRLLLFILAIGSLTLTLWLGLVSPLGAIATQAIATDMFATEAIASESPSPRRAQQLRLDTLWQQVYQELPSLPREDQYISRDSGKVDANSTLIRRFIDYHLYTRGRTPAARLDWKLTLADYLGANELIALESYPGAETLTLNPLERDRRAIVSLTRAQRAQLVDAIVRLVNPAAFSNLPASTPSQPGQRPTVTPAAQPPSSQPPSSQPPSSPQPPAPGRPTLQPLPSGGGADLLKPRR